MFSWLIATNDGEWKPSFSGCRRLGPRFCFITEFHARGHNEVKIQRRELRVLPECKSMKRNLASSKRKKKKKDEGKEKFIEKKSPSHRRRMKFCWEVRKETRLFIRFAKVTTWLKRSIEIERYFSKKAEETFLTLDYQTNWFSFYDPGIISICQANWRTSWWRSETIKKENANSHGAY